MIFWSGQPLASVYDHNVPCAVCFSDARTTVLMISGRYSCPTGWTREYYGYSHHRSRYECVDVSPETVAGGGTNHDGALFYHVEPRCGSLPCPPYVEEKELTCAVCTK